MLAAATAAALAFVVTAPAGGADRLEAGPADGSVRVRVAKRGAFAVFAHDHDFEVTRWRATATLPDGDPARAGLEVTLEAGSLRDGERGLSGGDRRKVDAQAAGPDVLDAARFPEIAFRSDGVTLDPAAPAGAVRGTLHGRLTLRGETRPVDAAFEAARAGDGWAVRGRARFPQSRFGIRPFSGFGGTVGVKDEVEIAFSLTLRPPRAAAAAPRP
jgi:polyisoprenoid-binding protein YceI